MPGVPLSGYLSSTEKKESLVLFTGADPPVVSFKKSTKKISRLKIVLSLVALLLPSLLFFLRYDGDKIVGIHSVEEKITSPKKELPKVSNLKGTHPDFIGRDNILSTLTQTFLHPDINYQNACHIRMIHGEGGLGKTETAIAFANQHLKDFSLVWWIDVETEASFDIGYRELARALKMVVEDRESTSAVVTRVTNYLQETFLEKPYLLILDNFEDNFKNLDFHRLLPQRGGAILMTSKIRNIWPVIEMPLFSLQEAISLFQKINPKEKPSLAMEKLAEELSYTPLLINVAAHTIEERSSWKASHYRKELTKKIEEQNGLLWQAKDQQRRFDKERTLAASWELTLEHFEKDSPLAFQWLLLCAYFRPTQIPISWIPSWLELQGIEEDRLTTESGNLEAAVKRFKVLVYDQDTETFSMHRFWQAIIKAKHKEHVESILLEMASLLGNLGQKINNGLAVTRQEREAWLLHLTSFEKLGQEVSYENSEPLATALNLIGEGLWALGRFIEATHYHTQALEIRTSFLGKDHLDIAANLDGLARSLSSAGKYAEADNYYQRALEMYKALLGETPHLDYAKSLNNRGWNLRRLGRVEEGLEYAKQGLEMRQKLLGAEHSDVASSLSNVGICLLALGRYKESFSYHKKALAIRKTLLGEEHPDIASSLNNLGINLNYLGRYKEALTHHGAALAMQKTLLGEEHPDIAWSLNNVGVILNYLGRYKEALALNQEALVMQKKLLGEQHPDIGWSLNHIGVGLHGLGQHEEALTSHKATLALRKRLLGEEHPYIARSLDHLGINLSCLGRYEEAFAHHEAALVIQKKLLGEDHPDIAWSLDNMGISLRGLEKREEALAHHEAALAMQKKLLGEEHPDIAMSLGHIGLSLDSLERHEEALTYHKAALAMQRKLLGEEHPKVAKSLDNIKQSVKASKKHRVD